MSKKKIKENYFTQRTRLSEKVNNATIKHADDDRRSISSIIAIALEEYLQRKGLLK